MNIVDIINKKMDKTEKKYPVDKAKGVSTSFQFTLSNANWKFQGNDIITLTDDDGKNYEFEIMHIAQN